jgi:hypothetical protein
LEERVLALLLRRRIIVERLKNPEAIERVGMIEKVVLERGEKEDWREGLSL